MNIYLDIDGVLVSDSLYNGYGKPANYAVELIKKLTENHECFWLTTHCRTGGNNVEQYLSEIFDPEAMKYFRLVKPSFWSINKTEGIDFAKDFLWIDDEVYPDELLMLSEKKCQSKLLLINLRKNPDQLLEVINKLCSAQ